MLFKNDDNLILKIELKNSIWKIQSLGNFSVAQVLPLYFRRVDKYIEFSVSKITQHNYFNLS
jgi:hypothetical protein